MEQRGNAAGDCHLVFSSVLSWVGILRHFHHAHQLSQKAMGSTRSTWVFFKVRGTEEEGSDHPQGHKAIPGNTQNSPESLATHVILGADMFKNVVHAPYKFRGSFFISHTRRTGDQILLSIQNSLLIFLHLAGSPTAAVK